MEESDLSDQDFESNSSFSSVEEDEGSSENVSPISLTCSAKNVISYNYFIHDRNTDFVHGREPDECTCGLG